MILIGLGANLPSERYGAPVKTLNAALDLIEQGGASIRGRSRWYTTPPVPASDQPWYVNGVAEVETDLSPSALLSLLLATEKALGRARRSRWEARVADLVLLSYGSQVIGAGDTHGEDALIVPHPRMHERQFVLIPLIELNGGWRHPVLGKTASELKAELPEDPRIRLLDP